MCIYKLPQSWINKVKQKTSFIVKPVERVALNRKHQNDSLQLPAGRGRSVQRPVISAGTLTKSAPPT